MWNKKHTLIIFTAVILWVLYLVLLVRPCYQQWQRHQITKSTLHSKLIQLKEEHQISAPPVTASVGNDSNHYAEVVFLALLNKLAIAHDVSLSTIKRNTSTQLSITHSQLLTVTLQGNANNLLAFLMVLHPSKYPFTLLDFRLVMRDQRHYVLTMTVLLVSILNTLIPLETQKRPFETKNLFCSSSQLIADHDPALLQSTPLSQIKMVGYLTQGIRHTALVVLHNHMVFSVKELSMLGQEGFKVMHISTEYIQLKSPAGETKTLLLTSSKYIQG